MLKQTQFVTTSETKAVNFNNKHMLIRLLLLVCLIQSDPFTQVIEISDYRAQLYDYIKNRMMAIAPNLTALVGELVGARLIAHAGMLCTTFTIS